MRREDIKWVCLAVVATVIVHLFTFHEQSVDIDDPIQSRLLTHISLLKSECLSSECDRPLEESPECWPEDAFKNVEGSACRWSAHYPVYSCRIGGIPVTLIGNTRLGGIEEVPMTVISRLFGPLTSNKILRLTAKICFVFLMYWAITIFALPGALLLFFSISPMFIAHGQSPMVVTNYLIVYLTFCLLLSKDRRVFLAGLGGLFISTYVWITGAFHAVPIVGFLLWRKSYRRALVLTLCAGLFLTMRVILNFAVEDLSSSFRYDLVESPIYVKSSTDFLNLLKDLYGMFTLSSRWADVVPPEFHSGLPSILGLGVFLALACGAILSKTIRAIVALFLVSTAPIFFLGHNSIPTYIERFQHLFPIAFTAVYLSAENCSCWLKQNRFRFFLLPLVWIWIVALASTLNWMKDFRETGPMMVANADFISKLSSKLITLGIHNPILINETGAAGTIELYSGEKIRPMYSRNGALSWPEGANPVEFLLADWVKFRKGTLLQRSVDYDWLGYQIERSDLESFAEKHAIEIKSLEFFPYREIRGVKQGFWIVEFINHRFD